MRKSSNVKMNNSSYLRPVAFIKQNKRLPLPALTNVVKEVNKLIKNRSPTGAAQSTVLCDNNIDKFLADLSPYRLHKISPRTPSLKAELVQPRAKAKSVLKTPRAKSKLTRSFQRLDKKIEEVQRERKLHISINNSLYESFLDYVNAVEDHLKFPRASVHEILGMKHCDRKINENCRQECLRMKKNLASFVVKYNLHVNR